MVHQPAQAGAPQRDRHRSVAARGGAVGGAQHIPKGRQKRARQILRGAAPRCGELPKWCCPARVQHKQRGHGHSRRRRHTRGSRRHTRGSRRHTWGNRNGNPADNSMRIGARVPERAHATQPVQRRPSSRDTVSLRHTQATRHQTTNEPCTAGRRNVRVHLAKMVHASTAARTQRHARLERPNCARTPLGMPNSALYRLEAQRRRAPTRLA